MAGNEKPERKNRVLSWVKTFLLAQLKWDWFEPGDIFDLEGLAAFAALAAVLCTLGILFYGFFAVTYQLVVDPDAVHVASRLDSLSINPDKYFPRS